MDDGKRFAILSETEGKGLPLVAWKLKDEGKFDEFAIARGLRTHGWIVVSDMLLVEEFTC